MSQDSQDNKRILRNTFLLYLRMAFLMIVNLYVSRVVLGALGVEDFGVYNAVAGFVMMFYMISASITVAISRFITVEIGAGGDVPKVFSATVNLQICTAIIIIVIAESFGLWFLNNKMNFPNGDMFVINVVYQAALISLVLHLLNIPFNALIIAHEKMNAYAYITIFDGLLKLVIALFIAYISDDKLIVYSALIATGALLLFIMYALYCKMKFKDCQYIFRLDLDVLKSMFKYAGWTYIGTSSALLRDQGNSILLNIFYGPVANATYAITQQVQSAVNHFATNFTMALNPQILKSYAAKNFDRMKFLIRAGTLTGFFLLFIVALPVFFNTPYILNLWLEVVPENTVMFVRLAMFFILSEVISNALVVANSANKNIRNYQLIVGGVQSLNIVGSYIFLRFGYPPYVVVLVALVLSQAAMFARLFVLRGLINLNIFEFLTKCYLKIVLVVALTLPIPILLKCYECDSFLKLILNCAICFVTSVVVIYFVGISKGERVFVKNKILSKLRYDKSKA